jgi:cell division protein FtsW
MIKSKKTVAQSSEIQAAQSLWNKIKPRGDRFMWGIIFILSIWGLLAIYSSTGALAYKKNGGNVNQPKDS